MFGREEPGITSSQPEKRIVARQMHKAILDYMNSDQFRPQFTVTPQQISELFTKTAGDIKSYTNDSPDELKPKINAVFRRPARMDCGVGPHSGGPVLPRMGGRRIKPGIPFGIPGDLTALQMIFSKVVSEAGESE